MMNIYVGNLAYDIRDRDLAALFSRYGQVNKATVVMDRESGRSKGFGFVELADYADGQRAIGDLAGQPFQGRLLTVNEARPRGSGGGERVLGDGTGATASAPDHGREETGVEVAECAPPKAPERTEAEPVTSGGYRNTLLSR